MFGSSHFAAFSNSYPRFEKTYWLTEENNFAWFLKMNVQQIVILERTVWFSKQFEMNLPATLC